MVWFLKGRTYPTVPLLRRAAKWGAIGVDLSDDTVKVAQLSNKDGGISLIAGGSKEQPGDIRPGSGNWQRWAIEAIREVTANGKFRGREVVAAMPASEIFVDHVKRPKTKEGSDKVEDAIISKMKPRLPFESAGAMIRHISAEEHNVIVIAAERKIIDRHLAIYESADLQIRSMGIWPTALVNSYASFFGRRQADMEAVVMLLEIDASRTSVVVCRHRNLLFARSIPIGVKQLENDEIMTRLVLELSGCKGQFGSMYRSFQIERLIFLSPRASSENMCATIAKKLEMPAQIGDCLAAVRMEQSCNQGIDRRGSQMSWATAFGLSLS
jgi:Tfp pilus assembly PilM family ATPase